MCGNFGTLWLRVPKLHDKHDRVYRVSLAGFRVLGFVGARGIREEEARPLASPSSSS
jgi:hypothetical protein